MNRTSQFVEVRIHSIIIDVTHEQYTHTVSRHGTVGRVRATCNLGTQFNASKSKVLFQLTAGGHFTRVYLELPRGSTSSEVLQCFQVQFMQEISAAVLHGGPRSFAASPPAPFDARPRKLQPVMPPKSNKHYVSSSIIVSNFYLNCVRCFCGSVVIKALKNAGSSRSLRRRFSCEL